MHTNLKPIKLGKLCIETPVLLAPMAGVTDFPFRRMVSKYGAGLMFSEMIASQALIRDSRRTLDMIPKTEIERGVAVQIFGSDPEAMAESAKINEGIGAPVIDINFGCPAKKIVKGEAGASLMRDERLAAQILKAVVKAVKVPVTLKMRLGWDFDNINAPQIAKIAEESGIRMITVHARTRSQFYSGKADWSLIRKVKESTQLPVIANGDIVDGKTAVDALKISGADGVMIGRGSLGRPWILHEIMDFLRTGQKHIKKSSIEIYMAAKEHFDLLLSHYGECTGLRIARKHLSWYSRGFPGASTFRSAVNLCDSSELMRGLIEKFFLTAEEKAA